MNAWQRKYMQRENVLQLLGLVPAIRVQQQQGPNWDLRPFPLWDSPPQFGKVTAPPWVTHCSPSVSSCVCFCSPAGVCHVWTVPSAAIGASTATCVPTTPPAVRSRRDESTPLRFAETRGHSQTITCLFLFSFICPSYTPTLSVPFLLCVAALCQPPGHVLGKTAFKAPLVSKCLILAAVINSLLSLELLSLASLNNVARLLRPCQSAGLGAAWNMRVSLC